MARVPSAIWVVDTKKEHIAVSEARKLGIPVVAILDTNCDPDEVSYPIPGNDDAIRSVALLTRVVADAVADGLIGRAGASETDEKPVDDQFSSEEPLPEWERDLLEGNTAASAAASAEATTADATADATADITAETATPAADVTPVDAEDLAVEDADLAGAVATTGGETAEALTEAEAEVNSDSE
jgi:small subunit ribosomal protein S2